MAMEPTDYNGEMFNAPYEVQLMNLGRIIENPDLIKLFEASDFMDPDINKLIRELKSDKLRAAKNLQLKSYMKKKGLADWGSDSSDCKREMFDAQRRQVAINRLAFHTNLILETLMSAGHAGKTDEMIKAIDTIKGLIDAPTRPVHG